MVWLDAGGILSPVPERTMMETSNESPRPLDGLRVIEMGQLLAGPFCGTLLGSFGAEVIKIEPPGGDPIRGCQSTTRLSPLWKRF